MLRFNIPNPRLVEINAVPRMNTITSGGFAAGAIIMSESRAPNDMAPMSISVMEKTSMPPDTFFLIFLPFLAIFKECISFMDMEVIFLSGIFC